MKDISTLSLYLINFWHCLVLALVVSSISYTMSSMEIFEPLRDFCHRKNKWIGSLFSCFYCLSHWVTFFFVAIYRPEIIPGAHLFINLIVSSFFIIQLSTYFSGLIFKTMKSAIDSKIRKIEIQEKREEFENSK